MQHVNQVSQSDENCWLLLTSPWYFIESQTLRASSQSGQRYSKRKSRTKSAIRTNIHTLKNFMYVNALYTTNSNSLKSYLHHASAI